MEQITSRPQRQWIRRTPSLHLPPYLLVVFILWAGFAVATAGVWALARYAVPPPSPFASFADVFPGQSRSAVEARGFSCFMSSYQPLRNEYCSLKFEMDTFSRIGVIITRGVISQLDFTPREHTLRVGDLMLLWGTPLVGDYGHSVYFFWSDSGVRASTFTYNGRFNLFLPVRSVSFKEIIPLSGTDS